MHPLHCTTTTLHVTALQPRYSTEFHCTPSTSLYPHYTAVQSIVLTAQHHHYSIEFHCTAPTLLHCTNYTAPTTLYLSTPLHCTTTLQLHYSTALYCTTTTPLHFTFRCSGLQRTSPARHVMHFTALHCISQHFTSTALHCILLLELRNCQLRNYNSLYSTSLHCTSLRGAVHFTIQHHIIIYFTALSS